MLLQCAVKLDMTNKSHKPLSMHIFWLNKKSCLELTAHHGMGTLLNRPAAVSSPRQTIITRQYVNQ